MPLSLEQYATTYLDGRGLPWPVGPTPVPPKARPSLHRLPVRAVLWNVYGTLLSVPGGELLFEPTIDFVMDAALDKLIQEFKMWPAMHRQPGLPSGQMKAMYQKALTTLKLTGGGGEKHPEVPSERIWDEIVKKLREYKWDVGVYGSQPEYVRKIAYFYHASIQGCAAYPGAADALRLAADAGKAQGLLADGQCFTPAQLARALKQADPNFEASHYLPANLHVLSAAKKARKPSPTLFQAAVDALKARGIAPGETLHVGSSIPRDIVPAKKAGMRTALFAGDKTSLAATADDLKDPDRRPDVLLTELAQIADVVS